MNKLRGQPQLEMFLCVHSWAGLSEIVDTITIEWCVGEMIKIIVLQ